MLRVACIVGVVYTHVAAPPTFNVPFFADWAQFMYFLLSDGLFRAGVPTLSIMSGYLLFRSYSFSRYPQLLRRKSTTACR